uniref:MHC class I-like antigen recognition-like domain-containing protein n=1 Tax=Terrapene triunguis TaxID=2587831 RepID=A0A674J5H3_9SAUR
GMLLPLLLLPWAWGALAASPPLPPPSVTLRLLHIDVFHNTSSTDMQGMALLGNLETHSLDCSTCEIRFLQPWAQQGLTPKQWQDLELLIHYYLFDFNRTVNRIAQQQGKGAPNLHHKLYPFVTQGSLGCELHPNGTSRGFYDIGVNGEDFISFDAVAGKWVARQRDKLALYVRERLNWNKGAAITLQFLLRTTCVNEIKSFVQYGKESLERQATSGVGPGDCSYKDPSPGTDMQPHLGWGRGLVIHGPLAWCTNTAIVGVQHSSHFTAALHSSLGQEVKGDFIT